MAPVLRMAAFNGVLPPVRLQTSFVPDDTRVSLTSSMTRSRQFRAAKGQVTCSAPSAVLANETSYSSSALVRRDPEMSASPTVTQKKIEIWLQNSVAEIIRNLDDAPVFHLVFDNPMKRQQGALRRRLPAGALDHPDSWSSVRKAVEIDNPDGLILVHELAESDLSRRYGEEFTGETEEVSTASNPCQTRVWGLVVLGRSSHRHACYILKTTRCSAASSLSATRFSITRAKCFGPSVHKQLESAWLTY